MEQISAYIKDKYQDASHHQLILLNYSLQQSEKNMIVIRFLLSGKSLLWYQRVGDTQGDRAIDICRKWQKPLKIFIVSSKQWK